MWRSPQRVRKAGVMTKIKFRRPMKLTLGCQRKGIAQRSRVPISIAGGGSKEKKLADFSKATTMLEVQERDCARFCARGAWPFAPRADDAGRYFGGSSCSRR